MFGFYLLTIIILIHSYVIYNNLGNGIRSELAGSANWCVYCMHLMLQKELLMTTSLVA